MPTHKLEVSLWSINRVLQWFGFRIVITVHSDDQGGQSGPTLIGLGWFGWSNLGTWKGRW